MSYRAILFYVIKILIVIAQTSEMSPAMKQIRVNRLTELAEEVVMHSD